MIFQFPEMKQEGKKIKLFHGILKKTPASGKKEHGLGKVSREQGKPGLLPESAQECQKICRERRGQSSGMKPGGQRQDESPSCDGGHRQDPGPAGKV